MADSANGSLATTYSLIYTFLKGRSHEKAAAAVKKAAKDAGVIVLRDTIEEAEKEKDSLYEIIKSWKIKSEQATDTSSYVQIGSNSSLLSLTGNLKTAILILIRAATSSESSSSDSSSDTSSESDSSDSSSGTSDSDSHPNGKSLEGEVKTLDTSKESKKSSSSEESNSNDDSEVEQKPGIGAKPKLQVKTSPKKITPNPPPKGKDASSSSSSDESESSDSKSSKAAGSSSDSSSDESDSKSTKKKTKHAAKSKTVPAVKVEENENVKAIKKRRLSESGQAIVTAVEEDIKSSPPNSRQKGKSQINGTNDNPMATPVNGNSHNNKKPRKSNTPFQRIKAEDVKFRDERLKDNTFLARGGDVNDYGTKANQDLIVTRGEGFRKEKNKKKRGSYRGGEITLQSHSIKFT